MKKVLFTVAAAMVMFAMTACCNNKAEEPVAEECAAAVEQCEHKCMHEGDSAMCCKAEAVEGQACEHKCAKAEGEKCCKGEAKECEHKCAKAEGKECCKKGEAKECEHKCEKAQ